MLPGVGPLIWRRRLVRGDASVADGPAVVQIAFGWDGAHRRRFVIHGVEYGIAYAGGSGCRDDPHRVHLADLGLRPTERFVSDYDCTAGWRCDLRLEQILAAEAGRVYPRCTAAGGPARRRAAAGAPTAPWQGPSSRRRTTHPAARYRYLGNVLTPARAPYPQAGCKLGLVHGPGPRPT